MNTPNPLQPQGVTLPRAKSNIYFKILMILAFHVVLIGGLLLQGCKDTAKDKASATPKDDVAATPDKSNPMSTSTDFGTPTSPTTSTPTATSATPTAPQALTQTPAAAQPTFGTAAQPLNAMPTATAPLPVSQPVAVAASTGAKEYVIVAGDMPSTIAKKNGVTLKALTEANPGMDAKKLQIGHKLQIPASTGAVASTTSSTSGSSSTVADAAPTATGDATIYVVKSGDMLAKIARSHGTTVKAIQAMNEMKTTAIRAGQKLKLPEMKVASADAAPAAAPATSSAAPTGATPTMPAIRAN